MSQSTEEAAKQASDLRKPVPQGSETLSVSSEEDLGSEGSDPLDLTQDEGWEDVEEDVEQLSYVSLLDDQVYSTLEEMLDHLREKHSFDLRKLRQELELDFLETIKLVNYVRTQASEGNKSPDLSNKAIFADDKYLQPFLQDDAVLFSLDEINEGEDATDDQSNRLAELEEQLAHATRTVAELRAFNQRVLDEKSEEPSVKDVNEIKGRGTRGGDDSYFGSYAFRDIHESMLKDRARTDAYRDFIYNNKQHFKDKIVLDVGCGTGILSMFASKAGAKHVYAVDNSMIVEKATENIFKNGFQDKITCIRGKVEEIELPVTQVDIIISEWMGYALLYEAMLDSVLAARDRFLTPNGLMVPCDMYLCLAPFTDSSLIEDKVTFWNDVYGFDMTSMQEGIFDEVLLQDMQEASIPVELRGEDRFEFLHLDLYKTKVEDLKFKSLPFEMELEKDIDSLDGFVIWFDSIFGRQDRNEVVNELSTGPHAKMTHWMQTILLVDHLHAQAKPLKKGVKVQGSITYNRPETADRQLNIEVTWSASEEDKGTQSWKLE